MIAVVFAAVWLLGIPIVLLTVAAIGLWWDENGWNAERRAAGLVAERDQMIDRELAFLLSDDWFQSRVPHERRHAR